MTPYELLLACEAYEEMREIQAQEALTMVWLGEYYHRIKKLPSLKEVLKKFERNTPMTDDEMLAVVKKLNAQFGGKIITQDTNSI